LNIVFDQTTCPKNKEWALGEINSKNRGIVTGKKKVHKIHLLFYVVGERFSAVAGDHIILSVVPKKIETLFFGGSKTLAKPTLDSLNPHNALKPTTNQTQQ